MEQITSQIIIAFIKNLVSSITGVQFAFITYTTKETIYRTAETSIYKLNIGANVENLYKSDIETLQALTVEQIKDNPKFASFNEYQIMLAKCEILDSLKESLNNGIGNNSKYTKQGYYTHLNKNVKYSTDEHGNIQTLYINALSESKEVLVPATTKKIKNSADNTVIKSLIDSNYLKRSKFREFRIDVNQIKSATINKHQLLIDASI
jgi:hypothetical protein